MKKVFISVGISGRNTENVLEDIARANYNIGKRYGEDVEIVHNFDCISPIGSGRLYCLGEAIKKLGDCDACYFVDGWDKHKGCLVEFLVCKLYGIDIIEENPVPFEQRIDRSKL